MEKQATTKPMSSLSTGAQTRKDRLMRYEIRWNKETVDETDDLVNARYLCREYNLAFHGGARIYDTRRRRYVV